MMLWFNALVSKNGSLSVCCRVTRVTFKAVLEPPFLILSQTSESLLPNVVCANCSSNHIYFQFDQTRRLRPTPAATWKAPRLELDYNINLRE